MVEEEFEKKGKRISPRDEILRDQSAFISFVRTFIEGNYFYIISAVLMMLGCFLLMRSDVIRGTVFIRTLKTLLILQGYELLVILTAIAIVRKFKVMGDAFTLLIIELVLLLDPTFFSNSFFTMLSIESTLVNVACFLLVPVKLLILQKMLRFRLSDSAFGAFMFAAILVYLAEGPLNLIDLAISTHSYFYLLGFMPLVFCFLLPPVREMVKIRDTAGGYVTERQRTWLPGFLLIIPLFIIVSHYIESSQVYGIRLYWPYAAPIMLGCAVLVTKNIKEEKALEYIIVIDLFCAVSLLLSWGSVTSFLKEGFVSIKTAGHVGGELPPRFVSSNITLILCAVAVIIVYGYYAIRLKFKPALYRIVAIGVLGLIYLIGTTGLIQASVGFIGDIIGSVFSWMGNNPIIIWGLIGAGLLALSVKFPNIYTWFVFGIYTLIVIFLKLDIEHVAYIPEAVQVGFLFLMLLYHKFGDKENNRYVAATCVVLVGLGRYFFAPELWKGLVVTVEVLGFLGAGIWFKQRGYVVLGFLQGIVFLLGLGIQFHEAFDPALMALTAGIIIFVLGILLSFNKKAILDKFERWAASTSVAGMHKAPSPDLAESELEEVEYTEKAAAEVEETIAQKEFEDKIFQPAEKSVEDAKQEQEEYEPTVDAGREDVEVKQRTETEQPPVEEQVSVYEKKPQRESIVERLESLFITDERYGIFLAKDLESAQRDAIVSKIKLKPDEELVVSISQKKKPEAWLVLLTNTRVLFKQILGTRIFAIYYDQIFKVTKSTNTVLLTGFSEQIYACPCQTGKQAKFLQNGLMMLVGEVQHRLEREA